MNNRNPGIHIILLTKKNSCEVWEGSCSILMYLVQGPIWHNIASSVVLHIARFGCVGFPNMLREISVVHL